MQIILIFLSDDKETHFDSFVNSVFSFCVFPPVSFSFLFYVGHAATRVRASLLMRMTEWCASTMGGGVGLADGEPAVRVLATAGA